MDMYFITRTLTTLLLTSSAFLASAVFADQNTIDEIERASQQHDVSTLYQIVTNTTGFDAALANYRLAIAHNIMGDTEHAITLLDNAQAILTNEQLVSDVSEAQTLLAQVYGYRISIKPVTAFYYGYKANTALNTALQDDRNNPRAHLIKGIIAYHTPLIFGGSKQQALNALNTAITLYQTDENVGYQWGHAEAYVWRGLTKLALDNSDSALSDWHASLSLAPNYKWPQMLLSNNQ